MTLYKRNKTWHTDFFVDGQRYRQSLHTTKYREAQKEQTKLMSQAEQGKLAPAGQQFAKLGFAEAGDRYIEGRRLELSEASLKKERQLLVQPSRYFRSDLLARISTERLLSFREWRIGQKVGPAIVNMEMGVIRRILKRAKRWHLVAADLKPLKERRNIGRAMTLDEKLRLLRLAAKNPDWQTARLAMTLALNTTMRGCELKSLRWRDIDLMGKLVTIRKSKTEAGERVIPLNSTAFAVILELRERAKGFNGLDPDHFVFPSCENQIIDPTRPQKSWRTSWRQLTRSIECPKCGRIQAPAAECRNKDCKADIHELRSSTARLRFHDLRHHAITELAESQASDQTIMAIAGHVSPKMLAHYSHVRLGAKRDALEALTKPTRNANDRKSQEQRDSRSEDGGNDTSHDTNGKQLELVPAELLEKNGRHEETRTPDLYRVKVAL
jgi:integrase